MWCVYKYIHTYINKYIHTYFMIMWLVNSTWWYYFYAWHEISFYIGYLTYSHLLRSLMMFSFSSSTFICIFIYPIFFTFFVDYISSFQWFENSVFYFFPLVLLKTVNIGLYLYFFHQHQEFLFSRPDVIFCMFYCPSSHISCLIEVIGMVFLI